MGYFYLNRYICAEKRYCLMQQSERIRTLSLLMIPLDERACIIEDEFIMADNFNVTEKIGCFFVQS